MLGWKKDIAEQPIETILLFERRQLEYFPECGLRREFAAMFNARPHIEWFARRKAPSLNGWTSGLFAEFPRESLVDADLNEIEKKLICSMEDWVTYVTTPDDYANMPFVGWDERELTDLADWENKTVVDIGSGTGKLAFAAAPRAKWVYCVEPVANLRFYLREKAAERGLKNVFAVDGLLEEIPFHDGFADVTMGGHVFGDMPERELAELVRVTKKGGTIILCPGSNDSDGAAHEFLVKNGFNWARFEEPGDGMKRKYRRTL